MSGKNRLSPLFHGRLNLEQQRKRAKELLKAARLHEPEALQRIAVRLQPLPAQPRLADAQHVIALENGFASWPQLKQHIETVDFARCHVALEGDRDVPTLHLRCGSDIRKGLQIAGFTGEFLEFADPFCVGPVPALPLDQHIRNRARFIASAFRIEEADALARQRREYAALESLSGYGRIVLWFEHDSYDQLILAYLLYRLGERRPAARIELIAVDGVPGVERFIGLGQLAPELLGWLWRRRVPVGEQQLALGAKVWAALTAASPEPLYEIACTDTPSLPIMAPALLRHLRELPDVRTGLGLTQQLTLEIVRDLGPLPLGRVFAELMGAREPLPFLGDTLFGWVARALAHEDTPLLALIPAADGEPDLRAVAHLTPTGRRVLAGEVNRLDLLPSAHWVGGIVNPGQGGDWCWDTRRPAWRAR
jgi:hypothetical protein